jgi:hypothetical protein
MRKLMVLWLLALCWPASAQVGSHLKEEFQDPEKHGIRVVDHVGEVRSALRDENVRILCLQALGESLDAETQSMLLEWVRSGHTVWFYDANLAPQLGMKPYLLTAEQFRNKPEKGVLGGSKRAGLATTVMSHGAHAVQTGVGQVTIFLPEIPVGGDQEKLYGAVEIAGDTVPLLQFALDSPALMALRRDGRGLIVFKTLLWNEPLSGDRFQLNLLDFSAGYQVPGPAGEGKVGSPPGPDAEYVTGEPAMPLQQGAVAPPQSTPPVSEPPDRPQANRPVGSWSLELKDGTTLSGEPDFVIIEFETGTQSLKLKPDDISSLEFGNSVTLDKLTTSKGKTQSGLMLSTPLKFRTEHGVEEFEKEDLIKLRRDQVDVTEEN